MDGPAEKFAIRREMRARRKALSPEAKARAAADICAQIVSRRDVRGVCAVYLASPVEIDLSSAIVSLLARGVEIVAPRWNGATYELARLKGLDGRFLRKGPMGILEPKAAETVPPASVSVWFVPGLAFTRDGGRLGYGGGWYDRLLAAADPHALKLGVAHGFQIVPDLPTEPHDVRLDDVLTGRGEDTASPVARGAKATMKKVTIEYRVPYADTDQMGVVYYGNYLTFFERARNELMRACGYTYSECEAAGFMLPVVHAEVDYRRPAKYDDLLEITAFVRAQKGVRIEIACEVRRKGEEQILVSGFTRHAFVSTKDFRPCPPPRELLSKLLPDPPLARENGIIHNNCL